MQHAESTTIQQPATAVWQLVGDIRSWPRWIPDISDVELVSGELTVGSEFSYRWRNRPARPTVTGFEPGRRIAIASSEKSYDFHESITLHSTGDETHVEFVMGFEPTAWWTKALSVLIWPIKSTVLGRPLKKELNALKVTAEAQNL